MKKQKLVLDKIDFELSHIFECGQCFRWHKQEDNSYTGVFENNVLNIKEKDNSIIFEGICNGEISQVVESYFDMTTDYGVIKNKLSHIDNYLEKSIQFGYGIRILRQDLWETIISFIISANNNIPRIQKIIERISKEYGAPITWQNNTYYTFPTIQQLGKANMQDLRNLGLGFRDKYVYETTQKFLRGDITLKELRSIKDAKEIKKKLEGLPRNRLKSCRLHFIVWYASF
ncbi:MAG: 8-oxoguanine DNA glycosylase [Clostridia bacterium]|nr:8-oxoguanine DNA glycosylase [Clostridia bacterium]